MNNALNHRPIERYLLETAIDALYRQTGLQLRVHATKEEMGDHS